MNRQKHEHVPAEFTNNEIFDVTRNQQVRVLPLGEFGQAGKVVVWRLLNKNDSKGIENEVVVR